MRALGRFARQVWADYVHATAPMFDVKGDTDEELAASLVDEMLRTGLTRKI